MTGEGIFGCIQKLLMAHMALKCVLVKKGVFTEEEYTDEVLRAIAQYDQWEAEWLDGIGEITGE